jgi:predicted ATPase with chaperone activity
MHEHVIRALEVAAVKKSNVLLVGSHGCGKTYLVEKYIQSIKPKDVFWLPVNMTDEMLSQHFPGGVIIVIENLAEVKRQKLFALKNIIRRVPTIATIYPCPCGYRGDKRNVCYCTGAQVAAYKAGLSMILDEFDIVIDVGQPIVQETMQTLNARMTNTAAELLESAIRKLGLSLKTVHKIVTVAESIVELDGGETIDAEHIAEAIQYRPQIGE